MNGALRRRLHATVALICALAGLAISAAHPLGHGFLPVVFALLTVAVLAKPALWPWWMLGGLPLAGLAPWTGWLLLDEVDLLVLACAAGGHGVLAWRAGRSATAASTSASEAAPKPPRSRLETVFFAAWLTLLLTQIISLSRVPGLLDGLSLAATGTYHDAATGLRLIKPLLAVALMWPLWTITQSREVHRGFWLMAAACGLWVLWERATYAGVFDFAMRYRVTGPFWETHVGGASLDAFLSVTWPMALAGLAGSVRAHRHPLRVGVAALLVVVCCYAMVVTYSRITYGALLVVSLAWALADRLARRGYEHARVIQPGSARLHAGTRRLHAGTRHLLTALAAAAVLWLAQATLRDSGVIMARFETVTKDWTVRSDHWRAALGLLQGPRQDPVHWAIGIGPGQFAREWRERTAQDEPPRDAQPRDERPFRTGTHRVVQHDGQAALRIEASAGARYWAQQHRVFQRLNVDAPSHAILQFHARVAAPTGPGTLVVELCEKQLLYSRRCAPRYIPILQTSAGQWLDIRLALAVRPRNLAEVPSSPDPQALRPLTLSLLSRDSRHPLYITDVSVQTPSGRESVRNGDYSAGLERWFFSSDMGHLPWSAHNALVHAVVEAGWLGAGAWSLMVMAALVACWRVLRRGGSEAAVWSAALLSAILGWLLVGVVDSLLNQVRAGLLLLLLLSAALAVHRAWRERMAHRPP